MITRWIELLNRRLLGLLYGTGIRIYGAVLRIAALWHPKARLWVAGRRRWRQRLALEMRALQGRRVVWFHCASLGEFEQGRRVMERFMAGHPAWRLVLTFFSPSGYQVRKDYALASVVCYLPLDTKRNAERFLTIVRPDLAFFVKYEYWYNMLNGLAHRRVPTFLISALFRKGQAFFGLFGGVYRQWLDRFTLLFVQTDEAVSLLGEHGVTHAVRAGDTRFDRVYDAVWRTTPLPWLEAFVGNGRLLVFGSTWPRDEEMALRIAQQLPDGWKLALVPHEIDGQRVAQWRGRLQCDATCYSEGVNTDARILVVDTVGLLLSVYARGDLAYVGGGFGVGIHNTLEPAAYGIPVVFGPNHMAFHEALGLLEVGGAVAIASIEQGERLCLNLMADRSRREAMGRQAGQFVQRGIGATDIILDEVERFI